MCCLVTGLKGRRASGSDSDTRPSRAYEAGIVILGSFWNELQRMGGEKKFESSRIHNRHHLIISDSRTEGILNSAAQRCGRIFGQGSGTSSSTSNPRLSTIHIPRNIRENVLKRWTHHPKRKWDLRICPAEPCTPATPRSGKTLLHRSR